jgi:hypothetical protein
VAEPHACWVDHRSRSRPSNNLRFAIYDREWLWRALFTAISKLAPMMTRRSILERRHAL